MRFAKTESNRMGSVVVQAVKHEKERARDALLRAASAPAPAAISMTSLWDRWMASRSVSARAKEEEAAAAPTARAFGRSASVQGRAAAAQYDFFDCDDDSTVMTTGSSNDGLRYRTRTDSSIPEDATATTVSEGAGAGVSAHADRNRYYVLQEQALALRDLDMFAQWLPPNSLPAVPGEKRKASDTVQGSDRACFEKMERATRSSTPAELRALFAVEVQQVGQRLRHARQGFFG